MAAAGNAAGGARGTRQRERQAAGCAPVTGLGAVRDRLERQPHDPFSGNVPAVLAELETDWAGTFELAHDGGWWTARPRDGTGETLRELSPDDLIAAMRAAR